jgi:23S rRNA (cytosine1962-C5)-methyltransferase
MHEVREIVLQHEAIADKLARGHPWVWREAVARGLDDAAPGEEVQVLAPNGRPVGRGLADVSSPIAIRMWTTGRAPIDKRLWKARALRACEMRASLLSGTHTNAYRVVHGEGDRMPGLVVDRYGFVAVARADGEGAAARVPDLAEAVWPTLESWGIRTLVNRTGARGAKPTLSVLRGLSPPDTTQVEEHGVSFVVDLAHGQKTGAFLDQRENRRRVGDLASGRRVLNLFSYAGGFALHAAIRGAAHVTSVDTASAAHATAQASFRAAGLDPGAHSFVAADVHSFLDAARARGDLWDLVVSDPPSFASNERALSRALSAYRALHRACADVLSERGLLCAASCSSHVDASAFLSTLDDAALGGRSLSLLELRGPGVDHPTLAAFPEGLYLKFAILG